MISLKQFLIESYDFKTLQKNKIPLTTDEREKAINAKAVWHNNSKETCAIWKAKNSQGKVVYVCSTHRAFQVRSTLDRAIKIFHSFIKDTA